MHTQQTRSRMAEIKRWLDDISYKHWNFQVVGDCGGHGPALVLSFKAEDAYQPGSLVLAEQPVALGDIPNAGPGYFATWLRALVMLGELHEAEETFCLSGRQLENPHGDASRAMTAARFDAIIEAGFRQEADPLSYAFAATHGKTFPQQGQCHKHFIKYHWWGTGHLV